jgi:EmrB/QacA subfamily drug resistance transporter
MPKHGAAIIPIVVACAFFMENFDGTVITTALPAMSRSLHSDPVALSTCVTAYLVSLAVFIPVSSWIADRYGASRTFRGAILHFTIASVFCGFAHNIEQLVFARCLQGLGGAMMLPVGRLIILRNFDRTEFIQAMSFVTTPALIGPVLGPPIGGFITTFLDWRWIFFLNVPIGITGIVLAWIFIDNAHEEDRRPFDVLGFILTGVAVAALMSSSDLVVRGDGGLPTRVLFGLSLVFGAIAIVHAKRYAWPLVDLTLFHLRTFATSMGPGNLYRATVFATPFLLPVLLQVGFGMSAFESGLLTIGAAAGAMTMKAWTPRILRRYGFRTVLTANGVLTGLTILALAACMHATPLIVIVAIILLFGTSRSLQLSTLNAFTFAGVQPAQMSAATSFSGMLQQLAGGLGIAASALLMREFATARGVQVAALNATDIRYAILGTAVMTILSALAFLALERDSGAELSGHRPLQAL